jgi:hypothetical protein
MKLIVLDCLRRWAWFYLLGFIVAAGLDVLGSFFPSFGVFTPYFLAPMLGPLFVLGADLMRGAAGVTSALPLSTRKAGLGYWIVGISIPPVLLSLALIFAAIVVQPFHPPIAFAWRQVGLTFVISLLINGYIFFLLTFFRTAPQEGLWNNVSAGLAGALWGVSAFSSIAVKFLLDARKGDTTIMAMLVGVALLLTVIGFLRRGEMVRLRARNRVPRQESAQESPRPTAVTAATASRISGLPYMFLESIKFALGMSLLLIMVGALLRPFFGANSMFIHYTLVLCAILPSLRYFGSLRHMRALPISIDGLAFLLFVLPLVNFGLCVGLLLLAEATVAPGIFNALPASLLLTAALASIGNSLAVRFGPKAFPIIFGMGTALLFLLQIELLKNWPAAAHAALSAVLMTAAFATLRSSLQSTNVYRVPAGAFQVA